MMDELYRCVYCVLIAPINVHKIFAISKSLLVPYFNPNNARLPLKAITVLISVINEFSLFYNS